MKEIKTVGIIGLGALGVLYAHLFTEALGKEHVLILADQDRIARYRREGMWYNGQLCDFAFLSEVTVDAVLFDWDTEHL